MGLARLGSIREPPSGEPAQIEARAIRCRLPVIEVGGVAALPEPAAVVQIGGDLLVDAVPERLGASGILASVVHRAVDGLVRTGPLGAHLRQEACHAAPASSPGRGARRNSPRCRLQAWARPGRSERWSPCSYPLVGSRRGSRRDRHKGRGYRLRTRRATRGTACVPRRWVRLSWGVSPTWATARAAVRAGLNTWWTLSLRATARAGAPRPVVAPSTSRRSSSCMRVARAPRRSGPRG